MAEKGTHCFSKTYLSYHKNETRSYHQSMVPAYVRAPEAVVKRGVTI
ncbi:MAG: hypothetical protein HOP18_18725 [Deltaproteobacteria bacterium]|nr:hypothetical protein [Deltaproteobacteria bacterium]